MSIENNFTIRTVKTSSFLKGCSRLPGNAESSGCKHSHSLPLFSLPYPFPPTLTSGFQIQHQFRDPVVFIIVVLELWAWPCVVFAFWKLMTTVKNKAKSMLLYMIVSDTVSLLMGYISSTGHGHTRKHKLGLRWYLRERFGHLNAQSSISHLREISHLSLSNLPPLRTKFEWSLNLSE